MLHLLGTSKILELIIILARTTGIKEISNEKILKTAYLTFICSKYPNLLLNPNQFEIEYLTEGEKAQHLISFFNESSIYNDTSHLVVENKLNDDLLKNIQQRIQRLSVINPNLYQIFSLIMHNVILASCKTAFGGTISKGIGVLWINPEINYTEQEFIEFIAHETTHTLMFLDEWRFCHYKDVQAVGLTQNYAFSAILGRKRPLDKVLHSIVVAAEILSLRQLISHHPNSKNRFHPVSQTLASGIINSVQDVKNIKDIERILSPRAFELMQYGYDCAQNLNAIATGE